MRRGEACHANWASANAAFALLAEVIPFHLDGLRAGGEPVPLLESAVEWVEV